jgi:PTS system mannitol-specific IIC component
MRTIKIKLQQYGKFLSNMVLPNIGAFIIWGVIAALFTSTGWFPNAELSKLVEPMIIYLLPMLVGYSGGKLVCGERGGIVGAAATMGAIVGTDVPMFLGAMIVGPLSAVAIREFDKAIDNKVKSGFEMLVNNLSAGLIGAIFTVAAFIVVGPFIQILTTIIMGGVNTLVGSGLLPLTSIFVEPAKVMFLNNAVNHGIFSPLGVQQSLVDGKSIYFLIEANPGPGLGLLLAYFFFGKNESRRIGGGAAVIHFFGGIHEVYFPYVFMNPRLIIGLIAGGMVGVFTLTFFDAGLVSAASPGSIFSVLLMTPRSSIIAVPLAVTLSAAVTFVISALLLKTVPENNTSFTAR